MKNISSLRSGSLGSLLLSVYTLASMGCASGETTQSLPTSTTHWALTSTGNDFTTAETEGTTASQDTETASGSTSNSETDSTTTTTTGTTTAESGNGPAVCGNGILEANEECDAGEFNKTNGLCKLDCTLNTCGDGDANKEINPQTNLVYEQCDLGAQNSDAGKCSSKCTWSYCGDKILNYYSAYDNGKGQWTKEQCELGGTPPPHTVCAYGFQGVPNCTYTCFSPSPKTEYFLLPEDDIAKDGCLGEKPK